MNFEILKAPFNPATIKALDAYSADLFDRLENPLSSEEYASIMIYNSSLFCQSDLHAENLIYLNPNINGLTCGLCMAVVTETRMEFLAKGLEILKNKKEEENANHPLLVGGEALAAKTTKIVNINLSIEELTKEIEILKAKLEVAEIREEVFLARLDDPDPEPTITLALIL